MKNIVRAFIAAALISTATESFARGFSAGLFGAYSIDRGQIENTINDRCFFGYNESPGSGHFMPDSAVSHDEIIIPGAGLFASYTFRNGFSIRTGAEFYTLISGGNISTPQSYGFCFDQNEYEIKYNSYAVPLLLGITLSPDKGRTNIYTYAGMVLSMINISQYSSHLNTDSGSSTKRVYESENEAIVPGFAALIGAERRLFPGFYVMLEFAFYKCEKNKVEWGNYFINTNMHDYSYTERYGLPRQQARVGARYPF